MVEKIQRAWKAATALIGGVVTWAVASLSDPALPGEPEITRAEGIALLIVVATALGVYNVVNKPPA